MKINIMDLDELDKVIKIVSEEESNTYITYEFKTSAWIDLEYEGLEMRVPKDVKQITVVHPIFTHHVPPVHGNDYTIFLTYENNVEEQIIFSTEEPHKLDVKIYEITTEIRK